MGNVPTKHHRSKKHHHHYHTKRHHHCHTKRHHHHRHKGGQGSPLNPNNKRSPSSSSRHTKKIKRDDKSLGEQLLRIKGKKMYSDAKRAEYIESIREKRKKEFREQKDSFLSRKTPRKSI
jgi:hypothetical protein